MTRRPPHPETLLARGGHAPDPATGAVVPPLHTSTTFARNEDYALMGDFLYARYGNPTVRGTEDLIRDLEGGADALLFGAGLGAVAAVVETLRAGDRLVVPTVMYHGAQDWMRRQAASRELELALFDAATPGALEAAVGDRATLVWIESPVNPTWDVIDIARTAELAHAAGAILVVDSTAAPPVTTRALALGADIVMHSATKYLNGHSDVLGGVLVAREHTPRWDEIAEVRKYTGGIMSPFSAWLLLRGLRTLSVRFARASATALRVAEHFEGHPAVNAVLYPGLPAHPGHGIAARQMTGGFGGMLSLMINGDFEAAQAVATRLQIFTRATSLGGVESLVEHRAAVEGKHSVVPPNLLRLTIGLEHPDDLIADLEGALGGT